MRRWAAVAWIVIGCTPRPTSEARGLAETEAAPTQDVVRRGHVVFAGVRDRVADRVVDADGVMWRMSGNEKLRLLDRVRRAGVVHADGTIVVREGVEPGRSSLWLVPDDGSPMAIATGAGADDLPVALPDGRVAFVSTRSSVASLWITTVDGEPRQLTNVGLSAGRSWAGFVPTPAERLSFVDGKLAFEDGHGRRWRVDPDTGEANRQ